MIPASPHTVSGKQIKFRGIFIICSSVEASVENKSLGSLMRAMCRFKKIHLSQASRYQNTIKYFGILCIANWYIIYRKQVSVRSQCYHQLREHYLICRSTATGLLILT